jgi:hypothetical protein
MILSESFTIIFSLLLGGGIAYLYARKRKYKTSYDWMFFIILISIGFGACYGGISLSSKRLILIEASEESHSHRKLYLYNNPTIKLANGEEIATETLGLQYGKLYAFNLTESTLIFFPVIYTDVVTDRVKRFTQPNPIYINSYCFDIINKMPDFWFCDPPQQIEQSSNIVDYIMRDILGYIDIKWCVIPYYNGEEE